MWGNELVLRIRKAGKPERARLSVQTQVARSLLHNGKDPLGEPSRLEATDRVFAGAASGRPLNFASINGARAAAADEGL